MLPNYQAISNINHRARGRPRYRFKRMDNVCVERWTIVLGVPCWIVSLVSLVPPCKPKRQSCKILSLATFRDLPVSSGVGSRGMVAGGSYHVLDLLPYPQTLVFSSPPPKIASLPSTSTGLLSTVSPHLPSFLRTSLPPPMSKGGCQLRKYPPSPFLEGFLGLCFPEVLCLCSMIWKTNSGGY